MRLIRIASTPTPAPADVEIDFDCEYDTGGTVYLWGALCDTPSGDASYRSFADPSPNVDDHEVADQFLNWCLEQIAEADARRASVRFYHYGAADAQNLTRILGAAADPVLSRTVNYLNDVIRPNFYAPHGYGLRPIAAATDAVWRTPDASGADTLRWIEAARSGDTATWDELVAYDTRALRAVRALVGVTQLAHRPR